MDEVGTQVQAMQHILIEQENRVRPEVYKSV